MSLINFVCFMSTYYLFRIVVAAIEYDNQKFLEQSGVNGYEYLEKIINVCNITYHILMNYVDYVC